MVYRELQTCYSIQPLGPTHVVSSLGCTLSFYLPSTRVENKNGLEFRATREVTSMWTFAPSRGLACESDRTLHSNHVVGSITSTLYQLSQLRTIIKHLNVFITLHTKGGLGLTACVRCIAKPLDFRSPWHGLVAKTL